MSQRLTFLLATVCMQGAATVAPQQSIDPTQRLVSFLKSLATPTMMQAFVF